MFEARNERCTEVAFLRGDLIDRTKLDRHEHNRTLPGTPRFNIDQITRAHCEGALSGGRGSNRCSRAR
jgi:hypothetical protein